MAVEKGKRENERKNIKLLAKAFIEYQLNVYKVFSRIFYNTKPLTNYQKLQLITLLHEDKLGKIQKSKCQSLLINFVGVAKIRNPCAIG